MTYQVLADGQVSPEVPINENMAALGQAFIFAHDVTADSGLVVGYSGGILDANTVADGTVTCTDNATNYVVVNRSTRAVTVATTTTNWNNTTTYGRAARVVFASGVLTHFYDERWSSGGIFDHAGASGTVSSVGLAAPAIFSVSGSPVTGSGTLTLTLANETANTVFAGATSGGAAAPTFRALVSADIPSLAYIASSALDTDGTLAANSSSRVPAQSAVVSYVASQLDGRSWKQAVRAATTANGTLATAFANGQVIDGVTLATGDRILLKDQTTGSQNGIYVVAASGAPTRATDADSGAELVNATCEVSEGTANADLQYTCSTDAPITPGSTALVFVLTSTSATYTADETTLHLSGSQFSLKAGAVGIDTHAATGKTTPVDADEMPLADSAASYALKKVTWANVKATVFAAWGALISTATGKTTPVDADAFALMDSAASNATKGLTWGNLKATLKTYFDGIYGSGSGSVTSVALTMPGIFSVAGSPVTTSGTLAASLQTQSANLLWAGPTSGGAASPTFRAIVTADYPASSVTYAKIQNVSATSRVLGRKTAGAGDPEECTLSDVLDFVGSAAQGDILYRGASTWTRLAAGTSGQFLQTAGSGANPAWVSEPFDVMGFYPGIPTASAKVLRVPIGRAVSFAANFSGSRFAASANATGSTVFDVQKNGSSIGSITIASSSTTATFTTSGGAAQSFAAGDVLAIIAPGSADATLADPGFALVGTR